MKARRSWLTLGLVVTAAWMVRLVFSAAGNGSPLTDTQLRTLAATVKPGQVLMYTTSECSYCQQAKTWLQRYGFAWTECNMSEEPRCEREFHAWGARGTPFFVITRDGRRQPMHGGLDKALLVQLLGS